MERKTYFGFKRNPAPICFWNIPWLFLSQITVSFANFLFPYEARHYVYSITSVLPPQFPAQRGMGQRLGKSLPSFLSFLETEKAQRVGGGRWCSSQASAADFRAPREKSWATLGTHCSPKQQMRGRAGQCWMQRSHPGSLVEVKAELLPMSRCSKR